MQFTLSITYFVSMAINVKWLDNIEMIFSGFLLVKTSSLEIIACSFVVYEIDKEGQRRALHHDGWKPRSFRASYSSCFAISVTKKFIHTLLLNMIGCQGIKSASNRSNKMFVRQCLLISFVIAMIYLITPSSSLPLEGALGSNDNRFRCK